MPTLTKKQMQQIIDRTPEKCKGEIPGSSYIREPLGRFSPSGANWSYVAGWTKDGDLVVLRFGEVVTWKI